MKHRRIKAEDLQFKGYNFYHEEYENITDTADLYDEFGTRMEDGTTDHEDVKEVNPDAFHHYQIKTVDDLRREKDTTQKDFS